MQLSMPRPQPTSKPYLNIRNNLATRQRNMLQQVTRSSRLTVIQERNILSKQDTLSQQHLMASLQHLMASLQHSMLDTPKQLPRNILASLVPVTRRLVIPPQADSRCVSQLYVDLCFFSKTNSVFCRPTRPSRRVMRATGYLLA